MCMPLFSRVPHPSAGPPEFELPYTYQPKFLHYWEFTSISPFVNTVLRVPAECFGHLNVHHGTKTMKTMVSTNMRVSLFLAWPVCVMPLT